MSDPTPTHLPVIEYVAAGGVVIHEGRVLLLDRPSRNEIRLPKGHVDPGESDDVAALRETVEETGYAQLTIVADLGSQLVEFDYRNRHYRRTEHYYLMRLDGSQQVERPPADAHNFHPFWAELAQAAALLTYPAEQATLQRAYAAYQAALPPR
jgi:8-oxo-dGTP pyrophosphatase MutT (NUDIX family)